MATKKRHDGNQVTVTYLIRARQRDDLKGLSLTSRIPQSALVREALDDLLSKYRARDPSR